MAKVTDFVVSGSLNNLVFYRRMGVSCVRVKPDTVRQSKATRKRSSNFGLAATLGKCLRHGLAVVIPFPANRSMQSRLSGALSKWLGTKNPSALSPQENIIPLREFNLNPAADLKDCCRMPITVSFTEDELNISLPAFIPQNVFAAPAMAESVRVNFVAASALVSEAALVDHASTVVNIKLDKEIVAAQTINLPLQMPAKSLTIVAASLQYFRAGHTLPIAEARWLPAGIIANNYS